MIRYIAILRGINVGGKRKILMTDLKEMFKSLGYHSISSYIQSGNVFFETEKKNANSLEQLIEHQIKKTFGFDVPVIIRTNEELESIIENNPFLSQKGEIENLHLTLLSDQPSEEKIVETENIGYSPDQFRIIGKHVYIYCEGKYHQSKLTNNFFEKKLQVKATTRNWKTVQKLYDLSSL